MNPGVLASLSVMLPGPVHAAAEGGLLLSSQPSGPPLHTHPLVGPRAASRSGPLSATLQGAWGAHKRPPSVTCRPDRRSDVLRQRLLPVLWATVCSPGGHRLFLGLPACVTHAPFPPNF